MPRAWETVASVETAEGRLELKRRPPGAFLITVAGRVLMNSVQNRSETALAELACADLGPDPTILIGGLGMGLTLRAALDQLAPRARVIVAELTPAVVEWCRGPLAELTDAAVEDPRVDVQITDVASLIAGGEGRFNSILLDLYEGPHAATQGPRDPFYGAAAIGRARRALKPGGLFAVWSEDRDAACEERIAAAGLALDIQRPGRGGRRHVVYLARAAV